jgi:hypothetical protein
MRFFAVWMSVSPLMRSVRRVVRVATSIRRHADTLCCETVVSNVTALISSRRTVICVYGKRFQVKPCSNISTRCFHCRSGHAAATATASRRSGNLVRPTDMPARSNPTVPINANSPRYVHHRVYADSEPGCAERNGPSLDLTAFCITWTKSNCCANDDVC